MRKMTIRAALVFCILALAPFLWAKASSREAYDSLIMELKKLEHSLGASASVEKMVQVIETAADKLLAFINEYPGTPEAQDAKFELGFLYGNVQRAAEARNYLSDYIENTPDAPNRKMGLAHYFLAESYRTSEEFDLAEKYYQIFLSEYSTLDKRLTRQARRYLGDISVLRRLVVGNNPIPFNVKDLQGRPLSLESYRGKVVLIDFWATWCGPCRKEMPSVVRLYNRYNKKGFEVIGISLDSNRQHLDSFLRKNGIRWPQYFDGKGWENSVAQKYRVRAIPATFLLDRKGKIRYKSLRGRELALAVEKLLNEE